MTESGSDLPRDGGKEPEELSRMSLLTHLDELRRRLLYSVISVLVAFLACWYFAPAIFDWLQKPVLGAFGDEPLAFTELAGPFMLYIKVALLAGIFAASPLLLIQLWLFLRPALYRRERRLAVPFIFFTSLLFLIGGCFGYVVAFPKVVYFLLGMGESFQMVVTIQNYFNLQSKVLLGMGLVFEIPMLIFFLARLGLVTAGLLLRWFRWAVLGIFVTAAIITPTPDIATQTVFAVPMILLYLIGVVVAWAAAPRKKRDSDETTSGN